MSVNVAGFVKSFVSNEKRSIASLAAGALIWWAFYGSKKYGTKGMRP